MTPSTIKLLQNEPLSFAFCTRRALGCGASAGSEWDCPRARSPSPVALPLCRSSENQAFSPSHQARPLQGVPALVSGDVPSGSHASNDSRPAPSLAPSAPYCPFTVTALTPHRIDPLASSRGTPGGLSNVEQLVATPEQVSDNVREVLRGIPARLRSG